MAQREKHKRGGRPRGSSAKLDDARALIAQGVEPLEALMRVGYSDPNRAYKQHAALIAESANKADPVATLKHIAQFGATADRVRACEALLALVDDQKPTHVAPIIFVVDARKLPPEQRRAHRIFTMPTQAAAAVAEYEALCAGSGTQTTRDADGFSAIDVLNDIVVRGAAKDSELRAACVALIKKHSAKVDDAAHAQQCVFVLPTNGRVPTDHVLASCVLVTGAADSDPLALFYAALDQRCEDSAPVGAETNNKGFV